MSEAFHSLLCFDRGDVIYCSSLDRVHQIRIIAQFGRDGFARAAPIKDIVTIGFTLSLAQCCMSGWTLVMGLPCSHRCSRFVSEEIDAGMEHSSFDARSNLIAKRVGPHKKTNPQATETLATDGSHPVHIDRCENQQKSVPRVPWTLSLLIESPPPPPSRL